MARAYSRLRVLHQGIFCIVLFAVPSVVSQTNSLVNGLNFERFKSDIQTLAGFGDRFRGSQSNSNALNWIQLQFEELGYEVTRKTFAAGGPSNTNLWATKVGTRFPDRMYIISAHMDGRGRGGAADDDASGVALVLEAARAFAKSTVETSVRFITWNYEEQGLDGSSAYVAERASLRGRETPPGSGQYPEPNWLGILQHDMLLFDHGLPPGPDQRSDADIDVEYSQDGSRTSQLSSKLADQLQSGAMRHSSDYPAQIGGSMCCTDSVPFAPYTAAVSIHENRRLSEVGSGSNPNWHQASDVFNTYSDKDFLLGFNAVQMTVGTVADLVGAG